MRDALRTLWGDGQTVTAAAARSALQTSETLASLAAAAKPANGTVYPRGDLATALAASARLIRAGVGAQVITLDFGGWDMHTNLGTVGNGDLKTVASELAKAVAAFFVDLDAAGIGSRWSP
jgi:uncharacterized protein (DUF1501 family)